MNTIEIFSIYYLEKKKKNSLMLILRMMETVVSVSTSLRGAYRPKPFCKCMRLVAHYINYNLINVSNEGAHMSLFDFVCQECVCIFVLEGDSRLLCDDPPYEVPQEGKIRCVPFVSVYTELQMFFSAGG